MRYTGVQTKSTLTHLLGGGLGGAQGLGGKDDAGRGGVLELAQHLLALAKQQRVVGISQHQDNLVLGGRLGQGLAHGCPPGRVGSGSHRHICWLHALHRRRAAEAGGGVVGQGACGSAGPCRMVGHGQRGQCQLGIVARVLVFARAARASGLCKEGGSMTVIFG